MPLRYDGSSKERGSAIAFSGRPVRAPRPRHQPLRKVSLRPPALWAAEPERRRAGRNSVVPASQSVSARRRTAGRSCAGGPRRWRRSSGRWWWPRPAPAWTMRRRPARRPPRTGKYAGNWRRKGSGPAAHLGCATPCCRRPPPRRTPQGRPDLGPEAEACS